MCASEGIEEKEGGEPQASPNQCDPSSLLPLVTEKSAKWLSLVRGSPLNAYEIVASGGGGLLGWKQANREVGGGGLLAQTNFGLP